LKKQSNNLASTSTNAKLTNIETENAYNRDQGSSDLPIFITTSESVTAASAISSLVPARSKSAMQAKALKPDNPSKVSAINYNYNQFRIADLKKKELQRRKCLNYNTSTSKSQNLIGLPSSSSSTAVVVNSTCKMNAV
jgi:plasmid replication initiation protein